MFLKSININNQYVKFKLPFLKEGYLIRWNKLSKTDFILLNGELLECIYKKKSINSLDTIRKIDKLKKYSINDTIGYHQIFNLDKKIKWSIHNYY